jgi:hypothetical protein
MTRRERPASESSQPGLRRHHLSLRERSERRRPRCAERDAAAECGAVADHHADAGARRDHHAAAASVVANCRAIGWVLAEFRVSGAVSVSGCIGVAGCVRRADRVLISIPNRIRVD